MLNNKNNKLAEWESACAQHVRSPVLLKWYLACAILPAICSIRPSSADEVYFDPRLLELNDQTKSQVDLSIFSKEKAQIAGTYDTAIFVNMKQKLQQNIRYDAAPDGRLVPELTPELLRALGVKVAAFPALMNQPQDGPLGDLALYIPAASAKLDFNLMRLNISIPQAAMETNAQDYVDPARWDDGIPVLFSNYSFSGAQRKNNNGSDDNSQYLNLQNGLNIGPWRLRNYSTYSNGEGGQHWDTVSTYIERDIKSLRSKLSVGQSATNGDVFDSVQFTGMQVASDDNMLPNSQRGFAPTIRGIANTNAEVTVRQNGFIIYQSYVAPGAFEINDLYPSSYSGDLDVTVKEADGTERHFNQPFSAVPIMQRPGRLKYSATLGRYRATNSGDKEPEFAQGTAIYGVSNDVTAYAGLLMSQDYQSGVTGVGYSLHALGSLSLDMSHARTKQDQSQSQSSSGESYRLQYAKNIEATETNVTMAAYRYSSKGYYDFDEANQQQNSANQSEQQGHKHSKQQININQSVTDSTSLYLSAYQQSYWNSRQTEKNLSFGLNSNVDRINYNLTYSYSKLSDTNDQQMALSVRIPLSRWLPRGWATYNISHEKSGDTVQQVGLTGTALDDNRLSYSLRQSHSDGSGGDSSSLYSSYHSAMADMNAGYYYDKESQQISYGLSGGIVAHHHGVTLSQPLGESFALVDTNGASGARIRNIPGVKTDWRGYAIVPYLTAYSENRIALDTTTLPANVDSNNTAETVIPNKGAMVNVHFDARTGYRLLIKLVGNNGAPVPFGAMAVSEDQTLENIVDDGGMLYLSGVKSGDRLRLHVKWGTAASQQCWANFFVTPTDAPILTGTSQCI